MHVNFVLVCCLFGVTLTGSTGYNYQKNGNSGRVNGAGHIAPVGHQEYHKEFFYFDAPEERFEQNDAIKKTTTMAKKNVRVIVIKASENKRHENAILNLANNVVEQKTHKEPSHASLTQKIQAVQHSKQQHTKPEVHFVKYRTPEEANRAQQAIIQKYESNQYVGPSHRVHQNSVNVVAAPIPTQKHTTTVEQATHTQTKPEVHFLKYKSAADAQHVQDKIIQQYGGHSSQLQGNTTPTLTGALKIDRTYLAPKVESVSIVDRTYLTPKIETLPKIDRTYLAPPVESTPVGKNYARNYLPPGVDVVPGSSYIPLVF